MQPQRIYIKDIKWLGSPYRHTVLKCSMKVYFKVIGCSCYTCLPQTVPATQTTLKMVSAPGTGTPPKDQRLLTIATQKQVHIYIYMQTRAKTKKQYINT